MNAIEYFVIFTLVRLVIPIVALLGLGEWMRSRDPRRFGRL